MSFDAFSGAATMHRAAGIALAIIAAYVAAADRELRPFAALSIWQAVANVARPLLRLGFGLVRPADAPPFTGVQRAAYSLDCIMGAVWAPGLALVALVVLGRRPLRAAAPLPLSIFAAVVVVATGGYPAVRGAALPPLYLGAELAALACAALALPEAWAVRGRMTLAQGVVLAAVCVQALTVFAGPLRFGLFDAWGLAVMADLIFFSAALALLGGALWMRA